MDNYNVLKPVGKGSFSIVYLCREKRSSLLMLNGIYDDNNNNLFIIKEINLDNLVQKYMKKSKLENKNSKQESGNINITPYSNKLILQKLNSEQEYYYKRLRDLIDSEIEVLNKLSHENIIRYYSSNVKEDIYYIKMEYCEYGDLYSILKDYKVGDFELRNIFNGFESTFIVKFLKDTVNALEYLHSLNIIHRDIKLHNVLVKKDKENQFLFKLSDFGFACFDLDCKLNDSLSMSDFDFSVSSLKRKYYKLCGTPYYMAPEIILNIEEFEQLTSDKRYSNYVKFYDKKVDLWSYGICVYELIFNMLPFSDIYDIHDLKGFFSMATTQINLHKNIDIKHTIDNRIKILLKKLLTINPSFRISTQELVEFINSLDNPDLLVNDSLIDIIDCKENMYRMNEIMKVNVMKEPLNIDKKDNNKDNKKERRIDCLQIEINKDSWIIEDNENRYPNFLNSWDKINKISSLITKISVDNNFMKWLLNNK
jgi:serine/threonine protein kinase